jgi:hypothetical protein
MRDVSEKRRVTLKRIADEVGVSPMTVSNAFSRPDQLSGPLRERILDCARELGYAGPDPLARGLRRGAPARSASSATPTSPYAFDDPAASAVIAGVCAAPRRRGSGCCSSPRRAAPLSDAVVDGIVVYSVAQGDPLLALAVARGLATVVIDQPTGTGLPPSASPTRTRRGTPRATSRRSDTAASPSVASGSLPTGGRAPRTLARRRRRPVRGLPRAVWRATPPRRRRRDLVGGRARPTSARGASAPPGAAPPPSSCGSERPPTAILATSDVLALGVLDAAAQAGLRVPDDLSVVGFDDVPAAAGAGLRRSARTITPRAAWRASCCSPRCARARPCRPGPSPTGSSCAPARRRPGRPEPPAAPPAPPGARSARRAARPPVR